MKGVAGLWIACEGQLGIEGYLPGPSPRTDPEATVANPVSLFSFSSLGYEGILYPSHDVYALHRIKIIPRVLS